MLYLALLIYRVLLLESWWDCRGSGLHKQISSCQLTQQVEIAKVHSPIQWSTSISQPQGSYPVLLLQLKHQLMLRALNFYSHFPAYLSCQFMRDVGEWSLSFPLAHTSAVVKLCQYSSSAHGCPNPTALC